MRIGIFVCCLSCAVLSLSASGPLVMKVSPMIAQAPASIRIETHIELDADNRALQIIAESKDFYRSSEVQLDGATGPRLRVFDFPDLPTGVYEVTGILVGAHGQRARMARVVQIGFQGSEP